MVGYLIAILSHYYNMKVHNFLPRVILLWNGLKSESIVDSRFPLGNTVISLMLHNLCHRQWRLLTIKKMEVDSYLLFTSGNHNFPNHIGDTPEYIDIYPFFLYNWIICILYPMKIKSF